MGTTMIGTTMVFAEETEVKGEVYAFIAASLKNAMEEIQKNFNETYPEVEILYNPDSSGTPARTGTPVTHSTQRQTGRSPSAKDYLRIKPKSR